MNNPTASLKEYARCTSRSRPVIWIGDQPWGLSGKVLRPLALPHAVTEVNRKAIRKAMMHTGALLALWTDRWDTSPCAWWYVCCDRKDYNLASLPKGKRRHIRRALENCDVRRVNGQWFALHGYAVYAAAFQRYGIKPILSEESFIAEFLREAEYSGRETWAAFIGDRMIAYVSCLIIDDAVTQSSGKSDPEFLDVRPNDLLIYALTHHYLHERGYRYVTGGARTLAHDTHVQDFLEELGYRKVYCPLRAEFSAIAAFAANLWVHTWAQRLPLGKRLRTSLNYLEALTAAMRISRSCQVIPPCTSRLNT
jgi:hypothetical protein